MVRYAANRHIVTEKGYTVAEDKYILNKFEMVKTNKCAGGWWLHGSD